MRYSSFAEFYPFYLSEHANRTTRRLHFVGSSLALLCILALLFTGNAWWRWARRSPVTVLFCVKIKNLGSRT